MAGIRLLGVVVVGLSCGAAQLVPVGASAASGGGEQESTLTLTVTESQDSRSVTLKCHPAGGSHPHATSACDELRAADGNAELLDRDKSSSCTKDNPRVRATAEGTWRGRQVGYQVSVANPCELKARTGSVFDF
ncbi:SSI family serine proteinase inhibitor [Saccharopolyspora sp. K220]|uniref:SSI family serine proteinase inhibitor n=1 Tax=Saccharopolyspora soli TaxID=2926618 RepID=UPI001F56D39C|nr:SSI family serine proteinase inhibitor [Saccharopolyspora soli]MCI2416079.1 SSI family serine proteinase inhibitor [Saccharopolyspora soli]